MADYTSTGYYEESSALSRGYQGDPHCRSASDVFVHVGRFRHYTTPLFIKFMQLLFVLNINVIFIDWIAFYLFVREQYGFIYIIQQDAYLRVSRPRHYIIPILK